MCLIYVWKMNLIAYKSFRSRNPQNVSFFWGTNHLETIGVENDVSSKLHGVISSPIKTKTQNSI